MVSSAARTVDDYVASLPPDRRSAIDAVRRVILANLPPGFDESMLWGMIAYSVPLSRYPDTYNGQPLCLGGLASQKGYMAVYLMGVYADTATRLWFETAYRRSGKKLDMGKSCVRFKKLEDLPLDVVGQAIARFGVDDFVGRYEAARAMYASKRPARKKPAAKPAGKKPAAKKKRAR